MATHEAAAEAQLHRALLAQVSDLAAIIAADGTVRYTSPSYQRIPGYSPADLQERSVFEHVHPDDLPRVEAAFQKLGCGHSWLLPHLIRLDLQEAPVQLAALREAVAQGDAGRAEELAHGLKGSAAQLGAVRMRRRCAPLQEAGGRSDLRQAAAQVAELQREFVRVRTALEAVLHEVGTG